MMYLRGVTIISDNDTIHTGMDLNLIQEAKSIEVPNIQTYTVEVPGRNGLLNLTRGLTGKVNYKNRAITLSYLATGDRQTILNTIDKLNTYHGQYINIIDDDTPDCFYEGEATISNSFSANYANITITIDAYPFRQKIDYNNTDVELSTTDKTVNIYNGGVDVVPTIYVTDSVTITKGSYTYTLSEGTYKIDALELNNGNNTYTVSGNGVVTISYREAVI